MLAKTVSLLATVSLVCVAAYVAICIILYLLQERFIFFPEKLSRDFTFHSRILLKNSLWT